MALVQIHSKSEFVIGLEEELECISRLIIRALIILVASLLTMITDAKYLLINL